MNYKLEDIEYETKNYWVLRVISGYEVYKKGVTHSSRCTQIGWKGKKGKTRAIAECNRRDAVDGT